MFDSTDASVLLLMGSLVDPGAVPERWSASGDRQQQAQTVGMTLYGAPQLLGQSSAASIHLPSHPALLVLADPASKKSNPHFQSIIQQAASHQKCQRWSNFQAGEVSTGCRAPEGGRKDRASLQGSSSQGRGAEISVLALHFRSSSTARMVHSSRGDSF